MKQFRNLKFEIRNLEKEIISTLQYFFFFGHPPTLEDIYTFLKKRCSRRRLTGILENMEEKSLITRIFNSKFSIFNEFLINNSLNIKNLGLIKNYKLKISNSHSLLRYTLGEYSKNIKYQKSKIKNNNQQLAISNFLKRQQISINKLSSLKFRLYIRFLSLFPQIKLIGLSGSVAMLNADKDHDIDLFIITAKNRLFTGRFISLLLAQILGIRRKRREMVNSKDQAAELEGSPGSAQIWRYSPPRRALTGGKTLTESAESSKGRVCLNLFFDESDLAAPKFKRSEYVAHEVLQMKPLVNKNNTYLTFIDTNRWVFDIFPNSKSKFKIQNSKIHIKNKNFLILTFAFDFLLLPFNFIGWLLEELFKSFQLYFINHHRTNEIVTDSQLWFHPEDFGKKVNKL